MNVRLHRSVSEKLDLSAVDPVSADNTSIGQKASLADLKEIGHGMRNRRYLDVLADFCAEQPQK